MRILRRQVENLAELLVRRDELQFRIENRDALADVVECGLQHLAIEMQGSVRVVEQFERGLGGHCALAQQE